MIVLPLTLLLTLPADKLEAGDARRSVEVGGMKRSYNVHVPPQYDAKRPTPVVLALHGAGMNGAMMRFFCALDRKADAEGFIVVYPDGTGAGNTFLTWNSGGLRVRGGKQPDDVAFIAALLDDLATVVSVDPKRVYATGMSNGAMMSYRLAAELSDRIAAIAPVAGTMAVPRAETKRPVPVIHFHGTKDTLVPYEGFGKKMPLVTIKSVEDSVACWVKVNGCKETPDTAEVADGKKDGLKVTRAVYGGGKDGAEVVLYTIDGGGHTWPGRPFGEFLGKTSREITANDLIWEFFRRHPMK
jgi:polyhydroxybutyrate depolymerase